MTFTSKHLSREYFSRRLHEMMSAKGWGRSELARRAGLPREAVSTYVQGTALPTAASLDRLANALETTVQELVSHPEDAFDDPSIDLKVSPGSPNVAWLRINRLVSLSAAAKIIDLLENDSPGNPSIEV